MSDDLLIKINASAEGVTEAYNKIKDQTQSLEDKLATTAKISGAAFAILSAQVVDSVRAYSQANEASIALTNALQNQGIYTDDLKDSYKEYAEQVQITTGFSAVQVTQAQAVAQTYLGQLPITQNLTNAIADLAQQQGVSLPEAATELGKAIGEGTGMLLRQGLQFAATDTEAERYQKTLDFVTLRAGGAAAATDPVIKATRGLASAFEDAEVVLGQRFAPAAATVINLIAGFVEPSKDSTGAMVDLKAILIAVGLVVAGLGIILPIAANGFLAVRAAAIALEIGAGPIVLMGVAIAALVALIVELALHWQQVTATVKAVVADMVGFVSNAFSGLGKVLAGALTLDPAAIKAGLAQIGDAFSKMKNDAVGAWTTTTAAQKTALTVQDQQRADFAAKEHAKQIEAENVKIQLGKAENDAILLGLHNASKAQIDLKNQEIATLKALENKNSTDQQKALKAQLSKIRQLEKEQQDEDLQREKAFGQLKNDTEKALLQQGIEQEGEADAAAIAQIKATIETENDVEEKAYEDELKSQVAAHNLQLEDQEKFGVAYAAINQIMHTAEVQGTQKATSELTQLTQSKNSTLKAIGKVATIANIVIKTAESAMNIYAGFSAIPFIGPALGIAGAAAAVAFGAEQIGNVTGAATGGLVQGSGYGDKVPYMLEPGELIAPRQNFNEVVTSVAKSRGLTGGGDTQPVAQVEIRLKDKLMDFIEMKIVQRKNLGISIQGS